MIPFISNISFDNHYFNLLWKRYIIWMKIFPCYIIILTCNIAFKQNEIFMHIRYKIARAAVTQLR